MAIVLPTNVKLLVGLGNPGPRFSNTRHNVGAMVANSLAAKLGATKQTDDQAQATIYETADKYLITPLTFMNEAGIAVAAVIKKLNLKPEDILVIHDDLDLPPGEMKIKASGSASGHNGVRSIIAHLKTDRFPRLRVGIGRPFPHKPTTPEEEAIVSQFVLEEFTFLEKQKIDALLEQTTI